MFPVFFHLFLNSAQISHSLMSEQYLLFNFHDSLSDRHTADHHNNIQWNLYKADTTGAKKLCPLYRDFF